MAIRNWHIGKVALVALVCVVVSLPLLLSGLVGVALGVALLATAFVVSWKWSSARGKKTPPPKKRRSVPLQQAIVYEPDNRAIAAEVLAMLSTRHLDSSAAKRESTGVGSQIPCKEHAET